MSDIHNDKCDTVMEYVLWGGIWASLGQMVFGLSGAIIGCIIGCYLAKRSMNAEKEDKS